MPTAFLEEQFPASVSEGSKGGPSFNTTVFTSQSGEEQRNQNWEESRAMYDVSYGIRSKEDLDLVVAFFYVMRGRITGFRFKDWGDYICDDEEIGLGTGGSVAYQTTKTYSVGSNEYVRNIKKLVDDTVVVKWNDVVKTETTHYVVNYDTGVITMTVPNAEVIKVSCQFDVPVRFDVDKLPVSWEAFEIESSDGIALVEVKN